MTSGRRIVPCLIMTALAALAGSPHALGQNAASLPVVYTVPGMEDVRVERGIAYKSAGDTLDLALDLYLPPDAAADSPPVVVFVNAGGLGVREWMVYRSWGRLIAASGLAAVNYDALDPSNAADLRDVIIYVREHAKELGVDGNRIAVWAASRNVAVALPYLADPSRSYVRAAVLYYGVTDPSIPLRRDLPYLIARAGLDSHTLNRGIDAQVVRALRENVDITLFNYQSGRHAFDVLDDTEESRRIVATTVDFLQDGLSEQPFVALDTPASTELYYWISEAEDLVEGIDALRQVYDDDHDRDVAQATNTLNSLGYSLLQDGRSDAAIAVFRLNVELHPTYANGWDSLGEGLASTGNVREAIEMYERALTLDPDGPTGANARTQLDVLRSGIE